uniref:WD repeat-containing protein 75-like n=1 Tax=Styela clava TaxID=7725 RepID=UPI00193AAC73|nr:WD repeat-containing protein 75-like [Styela clava]
MKIPRLNVIRSGGDSLTQHPPLFSLDSRFLFCACASEIKVFSAETGENTQRLIGHDDEVTGICHHPKISLQILSSSLDRTIRIWDYEDGVLLRTCRAELPLFGIYSHENIQDVLVVTKKNDNSVISKVSLEAINANKSEESLEMVILATNVSLKVSRTVAFLSPGNIIVFCRKKKLCVLDINNPNGAILEHGDQKGGEITCIACHPTDNACVTGQSSGIIKFWHNLHQWNKKSTNKKHTKSGLVVSSQHWHSKEVQDVYFTPGGASLLSVGKESVLVQWIYQGYGSKKDFFPRLGTPARHIAVSRNGALFATTHIDNSLLLITNYFSIKHSLEGFTAVMESKNTTHRFLEYDWKTNSCVTNGKPGHLLFYHPYSDTQLYNLDIVHQNYIASEMGSHIPQTTITNVAFTCQKIIKGFEKNDPSALTWMATIEDIPNVTYSREQKLKFWVFDEIEQWWKLNTVVNDPHKSTVTKITFRPHSDAGEIHPALLTTSIDGMAKIWTVKHGSSDEQFFWCCVTAASYRNQPLYDGAFSQDGSLCATAFGSKVCLSDPDLLQELTILLSFGKGENIKHLNFGSHSSQHILMVVLHDAMHACDLLSGGILWSVNIQVKHLINDHLSSFIAALTDSNDLFVFQPTSPLPIYRHKNLCKNQIVSASYVPSGNETRKSWLQSSENISWMQNSRIFLVDDKMSVFTFCTDKEVEDKKRLSSVSNIFNIDNESLKTPLASVLKVSKTKKESFSEDMDIESNLISDLHLTALKNILDLPSHVAPSTSSYAKTFLLSFLPKKVLSEKKASAMGKEIESEKHGASFELHEAPLKDFNDLSILDRLNEHTFMWSENLFNK